MRANIAIKKPPRTAAVIQRRRRVVQPKNIEPQEDINEQIRRRAYEIAQERNFEPGHETEDWLRAEHEVKGLGPLPQAQASSVVLRRAKDLFGFWIHASDGDIGHVDDFYFDDESWNIRYLVVNCAGWLKEKEVLISPQDAVRRVDWSGRHVHVGLTKEQVRHSPDINTRQPISRHEEARLLNYFNWPSYFPPPADAVSAAIEEEQEPAEESKNQYHIQSVKSVKGYSIEAKDGAFGHVEDFMFAEWKWAVRYMVVDTRNWLPGKDVLISPSWVNGFNASERKVSVGLTKEKIRHSPKPEDVNRISREYEEKLHAHYKKQGYWTL